MRQLIENKILPKVEKPLRYLGDEWNVEKKDWDSVRLKTVFAFPDIYEIGMSHLGLRIIYHLVNDRKDFLMERTFAPWTDMEEELKKNNLPLFSIESYKPLNEFDVVAFTLQYEMSFSNILNMLDLGRVPVWSSERGNSDPLVIAGGPCAYNPEPLADFIDAFVIGEGEEVTLEVLDIIARHKEARNGQLERDQLLEELIGVPGVYVPKFYQADYLPDGKVKEIQTLHKNAPKTIAKRYMKNLDTAFFPTKPIVPYLEVVHDRAMLEVLRGCTRGCRFCQAGMLYRPVRERHPEVLKEQAEKLIRNTGYNEISLTSLSSSDYTCIEPVIKELLDKYNEEGIGISLPSLRVDSFSMGLANQMQRVRKSSLTFAPEAGTQRLRDVINKGVTEENLMQVSEAAFREGWHKIKLYFMLGLPTETNEDLDGIADLAYKVLVLGDKVRREQGVKGLQPQVTISVAGFVPKAHTPFQWVPQTRLAELQEKQQYLRSKIRNKRVTFNYHDAQLSFIEAIFAKGDRKLGKALFTAWQKGCKFDGWSQHFKYETWLEAIKEVGLDPEWYAYRELDYNDILPWEHINIGVKKQYLIQEHQKAMETAVTGDCRFKDCTVCGICQDFDVALDLKGGKLGELKS
ncbi:MAG: Fe-S oxidoreductase [Peptococcaceae bacterium BICA1-8]|nr:MAG: Fe-S oxidoreductase [Peptococcaceae bacterium BICA1-8]